MEAELERLLGGPPRAMYDDIVRHPRLPEARRIYIDGFLHVYGGDPFLVRLLIESGRFFIFHLASVLDAAQDPARRETWATVGLLKERLAWLGLASGRQVDHIVARLCAVGFLELQPSQQDRRVRLLKPTEKLHAHDRDWLVAHYAPLAALYPQHDYGFVLRRDPIFQAVHRRVSASFQTVGKEALSASGDYMSFFNRAAGMMVISALLQAAMKRASDFQTALPYGDFGDRFGVSRTHVRKLLVEAEQLGLVKLTGRGGHQVEILPPMWSSYDLAISGGLYFHDVVYVAAARAYEARLNEREFA